MKNDCRKSDKSIVPKKSSNKPDTFVGEEKMEGRGLPKENKKQQNMLRTQCRESVLKKLQLIHQKAKADNKMKFPALMHHIYNIDMLRLSYLEIKRNAAPGVDNETWDSYGKDLEENLQNLSEALKGGTYKAKPVHHIFDVSGT